jgi:hypothetical protein
VLRLWPGRDFLRRYSSLQEGLFGEVLDELNETFDTHQAQRPAAAYLPQFAAVVRDADGVAAVAEQIAEHLHVGAIILQASALQMCPFGPNSWSSGLLASASFPEVGLESCIWPLQGKLSPNLVEIQRQRAPFARSAYRVSCGRFARRRLGEVDE